MPHLIVITHDLIHNVSTSNQPVALPLLIRSVVRTSLTGLLNMPTSLAIITLTESSAEYMYTRHYTKSEVMRTNHQVFVQRSEQE